jgi:hypothetical protein
MEFHSILQKACIIKNQLTNKPLSFVVIDSRSLIETTPSVTQKFLVVLPVWSSRNEEVTEKQHC